MGQQFGTQEFDRFVHNLSRSGLFAPEVVAERLCAFNERPETDQLYPTALTELGSWLVSQRLITCWQFAKLCEGKWKGFFMDEYKILDHLGPYHISNIYLAESVATGARVALRVSPPAAITSGKIEYQIVQEFR